MEALSKKRESCEKNRAGFKSSAGTESMTDSSAESRESSSSRSSSETSSEEVKRKGPNLLGWPIRKAELCKSSAALADLGAAEQKENVDDLKYKDLAAKIAGWVMFFMICGLLGC